MFKFRGKWWIGILCCAAAFWLAPRAAATVFGTVRGIVHDPQHRPVAGAAVRLKAFASDWQQTAQSDSEGAFSFAAVPLGEYVATVTHEGFSAAQQQITVIAESSPILHFQLQIASISQTVTVSAEPSQGLVTTDSVTPTTLVGREDITETPGADRTNAMQMITDFVPGAYVTHDMLHIRGGHQVDWLIDGVPIPNTNIASNLAPQIDPKDIDYLEALRGSYDPEYGDRTYGIFNIVPRSGFERDRECSLVSTLGNFYQTNDQISCGAHTQRFAWFVSLNGNRSEYGLQTPIPNVVHDAENGYGGFASFLYNLNATNQLRLVTSLRTDYYQVPIDPNPNSLENQVYPSSQLHDAERETDGYLAFSWVHTFNPNVLLTVSPFYHYNRAQYDGGATDYPVISSLDQSANYGGVQAAVDWNVSRNDLHAGIYGFGQRQFNQFENTFTDGSTNYPGSAITVTGGLESAFLSDSFKVAPWLTAFAGLRQSHFTADVVEDAVDPRVGLAVQVPHLKWVFRAFYGRYYQAPPLVTATGPLLDLATSQDFTFAPLHGERDEEAQFGLAIPFRGWVLDADTFGTRAKNWLDHNNIGESNLFWPITWQEALIRAWELTLRSPRLWHRGQFHLAYSNQIAKATAPITGGLICPPPINMNCGLDIAPGYSPVDHDQRNTLNLGFTSTLPWQAYASTNVYYGSGFTNGLFGTPQQQYPGPYLPQHTTFDISLGKSFAEKYTVSVTALNVANRRVQLDNSLTFGGFHWNDPRQLYVEFRYRFHY